MPGYCGRSIHSAPFTRISAFIYVDKLQYRHIGLHGVLGANLQIYSNIYSWYLSKMVAQNNGANTWSNLETLFKAFLLHPQKLYI